MIITIAPLVHRGEKALQLADLWRVRPTVASHVLGFPM